MNDKNDGFGTALRRARSVLTVAAIGALAAACGSDVEGTYTAVGDSLFISSITLGPDGKAKVESPLLLGGPNDTTYTVEKDTVSIIMPDGDPQPFTAADDCLTHTGPGAALQLIPKLCKGGKSSGGSNAASTAAAPAPAAAAGGAETYLATVDGGRIQLDLLTGGAARMKMMPAGGAPADAVGMTFDLTYTRSGNDVTVQMPFGEPPMLLTRTGRDFTATMEGETARFVRQ